MSNIKRRGTKKTSMDKKGGECTYTIIGKEPVSARIMNTILNGMMRERWGRLQFQCKYQKLQKTVTSVENGGGTTGVTTTSPIHKKTRSCSQNTQ